MPPDTPTDPDADAAAAALGRALMIDNGDRAHAALEDAPLMSGLPFAGALGMRLVSSGGGAAVLGIAYDAALVGDPETGVIHGGVVTSLLDTAGGAAVLSSPTRPMSVATLDLRIDYMRPAEPKQPLFAKAVCYRETRLVTFVKAVAYHEGCEDAPVANAIGAFMVDGRRRAAPGDAPAAAATDTPPAERAKRRGSAA